MFNPALHKNNYDDIKAIMDKEKAKFEIVETLERFPDGRFKRFVIETVPKG